jgi:large subunit ribosomal protein L34e
MPAPRHRSRTFRRLRTTTPSGIRKINYKRRMPKAAHCAACGNVLKGTPRVRDAKMRNLPKTMKRPERPFAGMLCSSCMRRKFISDARNIQ